MPTLLENKGVFSPVINDSKILPRNSSGIPLPVSDMIILQMNIHLSQYGSS